MGCRHVNWEYLPIELLQLIAERLEYLNDFMRFSATCKSWNSATLLLQNKRPWLPLKYPWLLLAEDTGLDLRAVEVITGNQDPVQTWEITTSARGLFSLATQKIYNLDLPEAMGKLILGTNKGWLVTLGKDLEINLLHPLLREQIALPPMLTLPIQMEYDDDFRPQDVYTWYLRKVVMSSQVPALQNHDTNHLPMIMAIYEHGGVLASARLGDKLWTKVETSDDLYFDDIIYHKEKFYAITERGEVFMCDIDNGHQKVTTISSIPTKKKGPVSCYLIESLSGNHIWVVIRILKYPARPLIPGTLEYYTSNFQVLKLEVYYSNSGDATTSCTWTEQVKDLGNEALFIGRASSMSTEPSEFIKPNNIYFTDDNADAFISIEAGGHDMGIFNVETGKIQPHFPGLSIHPFSPPLWYL